jgi:glutathione S-transferase
MSKLTLKYWNGRGLMEVPRLLLAIAGKFPGTDYEDGRFGAPPDNLEANLGRMPVVIDGDASVGQSVAINYYIAAENGLLGSSNLEAAQILAICEHIKEMITVYRTLVPWGEAPSDESLTQWFTGGATDSEGPADGSSRSTRYLTWWCGRIEKVLGNSGFAVGNKISLADAMIYNTFAEVLKESEVVSPDVPQWKREPFCSLEKTQSVLTKCPKIQASIAAISANANAQKWLETRGTQYF